MGQMAELNLAAAREENGRLRALVVQQQRVIAGMQERDRVGAMEVAFIGAALGAFGAQFEVEEREELAAAAIELGRTTAKRYIEALMAEAEKPAEELPDEGSEEG